MNKKWAIIVLIGMLSTLSGCTSTNKRSQVDTTPITLAENQVKDIKKFEGTWKAKEFPNEYKITVTAKQLCLQGFSSNKEKKEVFDIYHYEKTNGKVIVSSHKNKRSFEIQELSDHEISLTGGTDDPIGDKQSAWRFECIRIK